MTTDIGQLKKLKTWFESGEAYALVQAYQTYHQMGTTGVLEGMKSKPAVMNERGILQPQRFEDYMAKLQTAVETALPNGFIKPAYSGDLTLPLLQSTLEQMIGSVSFGEDVQPGTDFKLRDLFENGKQIGRVLRENFGISYQVSGASAGFPSGGNR